MKVIIADDEQESRIVVKGALAGLGLEMLEAENATQAVALMKDARPDLIISDMRMPGGGGWEVIRSRNTLCPEVPLLIFTGCGSGDDAEKAMDSGVTDYLEKPLNVDDLEAKVRECLHLDQQDLDARNYGLIGHSQAILDILDKVRRYAGQDGALFIGGETGTGKTLLAQAIYEAGPRAGAPFQKFSCADLNENTLRSELFGHEKGAFTGADRQKKGYFETAGAGTIFLDEIGSTSKDFQSALLRVVDEHKFKRMGSTEDLDTEARIITASNESLDDLVKAGRFRDDLRRRLETLTITMPPLRERKEDVPELANYFLKEYNTRQEKDIKFSPLALDMLKKYPWPGNVRELKNTVEGLCADCSGTTITPGDVRARLKPAPQAARNFSGLSWEELDAMTAEELEMRLVRHKLEQGKTQKSIAGELGISLRTVSRWLNGERGQSADSEEASR